MDNVIHVEDFPSASCENIGALYENSHPVDCELIIGLSGESCSGQLQLRTIQTSIKAGPSQLGCVISRGDGGGGLSDCVCAVIMRSFWAWFC